MIVIDMKTSKLCSLCVSTALALSFINSAGATSVTVGGISVPNEGMMTSVAGASTITFDGLKALPGGFVASGTHPSDPLVKGDLTNIYKTPTGDTSTFLTTGTGTITDTLKMPATYFGFYWGSLDNYNEVQLTDGDGTVFSLTGQALATNFDLTANGNASYFVNFFADPGTTFMSVEFSSSSDSFEFDNVATATPEPASAAMLGGGLLICVGCLRRKRGARLLAQQ